MSTQAYSSRPLARRQDLYPVAAAWEAFMAGHQTGLEHVRPSIRASWQRCQRLKINPYQERLPVLAAAQNLESQQEQADLVAVAGPLFETIVAGWEQEHFLLFLSNRFGRILQVDGHPSTVARAAEINGVPGGEMAEEHVGTAVANIVLSQGRADYVLWYEHYCQRFHSWAALGAPIHHPVTNELIGVVGTAGEELTPPRAFELIGHIASRLEHLLYHEELVRRTTLLNAYYDFLLQHPQDTVLALDGRGHICGVSPNIGQIWPDPHQLLAQSVLRIPGLQLTGLRLRTSPEEDQPYSLQLSLPDKEVSLTATALPIEGQRQPVGTLLVFTLPRLSQHSLPSASPEWSATYTFSDLIGEAPAFQACVTQARRAAASDFPVLLHGESGTGKELLAQAIHTASPRRSGSFVAVNCGTLNDELLTTELFGYVDGAFTGAVPGGRKGKFEVAHGGTLFLDEVEAMPSKMQVSLLRVLEEGRVTPIGAERPVQVDVRVIAASCEDLDRAVEAKRFRLDLYYRLAVLPIRLPALRDRTEDIPLLAEHFLKRFGTGRLQLGPAALERLRRYAWPGNVRELRNVLQRAALLVTTGLITPAQLPAEVNNMTQQGLETPGQLRATERQLITQALAATHGNLAQAAAQLGIHRTTLYRKLKRVGLNRRR